MFFNSTYHWLLIEEDYTFISAYEEKERKNNNNNNLEAYVKEKNIEIGKEKIIMGISRNTINTKMRRRKLEQALLSTSMSVTRMPVEAEKLTTLAIDITENYQQQLNTNSLQEEEEEEEDKIEEKLNSWYLSKHAAISDKQREKYSTKRQIAAVTPITKTTMITTRRSSSRRRRLNEQTFITNIKTAVDRSSSSIDNILYGKKANCKSKETDKNCIVNLDITTTTTTTAKANKKIYNIEKNQIDDVDGYNIDIIEKFLQQLEININTELILAKRRWHQLQYITVERQQQQQQQQQHKQYEQQNVVSRRRRRRRERRSNECYIKKNQNICSNIERVMAASHQCVNKTADNNVDDITTTITTITYLNDKHLNNDTSTGFAYDAIPIAGPCLRSYTFKSLPSSAITNGANGASGGRGKREFMYELTDDYLLHDIW